MTADELASYIDLTLLKPDAGIREIEGLILDVQKHPFASVCIPPCQVRFVGDSHVKVGTVVGDLAWDKIKGETYLAGSQGCTNKGME